MLPENAMRDELRGLIGKLPDSELNAAKRYLEFLLTESQGKESEVAHKRGTIGALKAAIRSFPPLPPGEPEFDLTQFLMEERERSMTDFRNPLTER